MASKLEKLSGCRDSTQVDEEVLCVDLNQLYPIISTLKPKKTHTGGKRLLMLPIHLGSSFTA
jgi:hypothetical protein